MKKGNYILRPRVSLDDIKLRREEAEKDVLKQIKKGLITLHNLELMAMTIYTFQITKKPTELNRQLIAAMGNEMTHYQDFQVKLYEYGFHPSKFRWVFWFVGFTFGFGSRILGRSMRLKTGIWVEKKAVHHYQTLLDTIPWDDDTRKVIEKEQEDEKIHGQHWNEFLKPDS